MLTDSSVNHQFNKLEDKSAIWQRNDEIGRFPWPMSVQLFWLRVFAYPLILLVGLVQAWSSRHFMLSDGISYLEIASAYLRHDWASAINAYWSPLFSWLLAGAFWLLKPAAYWQVATLHLVNFLTYVGALLSLEMFLFEVSLFFETGRLTASEIISPLTVYIAGYAIFPLATLSLIQYPSPDILATALTLFTFSLILRIERTGGSRMLLASLGVLCALLYLDRTAFLPSVPICITVVLILLQKQAKRILWPATLMIFAFLIIAGPFIGLISYKKGKFTVGEAGKLTYGWEVDGAARWMYWQGEPGDLGTPLHPPQRVTTNPAAYVFDGPVGGTFPPWFDPSYWYEGIHLKLKIGAQLHALIVNLSIILRLLVVSPIAIPAFILILHMGVLLWWRRFLAFWPVLVPTVAGLLLYSLIYVEKRYIVPNLLIVWITMLASLRIPEERWRYVGNVGIRLLCLIIFVAFAASKTLGPLKDGLQDMKNRREHEGNTNALVAERLKQMGIHPGDKVAYIGTGMNATDWARIDDLRVIGEVPVIFKRPQKLFNNYETEDSSQVKAFWNGDANTRQRVQQAFRDAGAVMLVTDGKYCDKFPPEWKPILLPDQIGDPTEPFYDSRSKEQYLWLVQR